MISEHTANPRVWLDVENFWYNSSMNTTLNTTAFDRSTEPLLRILTPEQIETIVHFRADKALEDWIDELARKSTEGALTAEERAEYEGYVRANSFIATLQMQARKLLSHQKGA